VTLDPALLPAQLETPETVRLRLARVSVDVQWGQGRRFELVTLRVWQATQ
jgi:hypothetical protein